MVRFAAVLLTIWAGAFWTICFLVAPLAFATLDDRQIAGQIAGRLFEAAAWLGAAIAVALLLLRAGRPPLHDRIAPRWLLLTTAALPLVSELALGPLMRAARAVNDMQRFGMLHGVSAVLFFAACLGLLALVWRFNRPAE